MNAFDVIIKPVLSEKSYKDIPAKKYVFVVDPRATKTQIKNAVQEAFGVKVKAVNTVNVKGKLKRQGRSEGYTSDIKKAYVTLTDDSDTIKFFESLA